MLLRSVRGEHAPIGLHEVEPAAEAAGVELPLQSPQVRIDHGREIRVHDRRAGALVLAILGHHLTGERHLEIGRKSLRDLPYPALVQGILIRVQ